MRSKEHYAEQYKMQSHIIGGASSMLNRATITGIASEVQNEIKIVEEGVVAIKTELKKLNDEWVGYRQLQINLGNRPPSKWPDNLQDRKNQCNGKLLVRAEELKALDIRLKEAEKVEAAPHPEKDVCLPSDRASWGAGKLWNSRSETPGLLKSIGGQEVALKPDADGVKILHIDDKRSPYNGMPVWEFKSKVLRAMSLQASFNNKIEARKAALEKRGIKKVAYPKAPIYHPKSQAFEYPGYNERVIAKIKKS